MILGQSLLAGVRDLGQGRTQATGGKGKQEHKPQHTVAKARTGSQCKASRKTGTPALRSPRTEHFQRYMRAPTKMVPLPSFHLPRLHRELSAVHWMADLENWETVRVISVKPCKACYLVTAALKNINNQIAIKFRC